MKHIAYLTLKVLVVVALAIPVMAGGDHKCSESAEACINKITTKAAKKGWLGVELDKTEEGMVIQKVVEMSPAAGVYLKTGDRLVALNGVKYSKDTKSEAMEEAYKQVKPGNTVTYTIARDGMEKDVKVTLGHMPEEIVAKWLGRHMLESHATMANVN